MGIYKMKLIDKELERAIQQSIPEDDKFRIMRLIRRAESETFFKRYNELKQKMKEAFKEIRKEFDIYIRQGFSCCGSCGSYELHELCEKTGKKGYMFYSRQSKNSLYESGSVYFNFGSVNNNKNTTQLGKNICRILRKHNVNFEWDGSKDTAILIKV